jgi:hypothetical protein
MSSDDERTEQLLDYLKSIRGFDFTAYKRSSLIRRIQKRLQVVNSGSYEDYQTYLEKHPQEFGLLFNTILINVTSFFRDPEAWDFLSGQIVPRVLAAGRADSVVRVWSPGCASGEEAYTIAMILAEQLGVEQFRRRVKIYASDVDDDALTQARHASYTAAQVQEVPSDFLSLPQGPSTLDHLRAPRPRAGRADLPRQSPGVSQHAHVLHTRRPGQSAAAFPLRSARRRLPVHGASRATPHARRAVHAG